MNQNQDYQNKVEQRALEFVRNNLTVQDCFGLSDVDIKNLIALLNKMKANTNSNKFPDFVFKDSFIEHFEVTSSLENRKGSNQKRQSKILKENSQKDFLKQMNDNNLNNLIMSSYNREFEEHSHKYITASFKKNWKTHIKSFEKADSLYKTGIFLIEYKDSVLETAFVRKNELTQIFDTYRITGDKFLLEWIYSYREKIDYLIFINPVVASIEVIKINKIPNIIKKLPEAIHLPTIGFESHKFVGFKTEKKYNDET